ncbi:MAG: YeeE/YedE family protein [Deltaproteobacteria bacterium]|nr:YeeE/YedE family protein [Deltaproteobacteria bacterium]
MKHTGAAFLAAVLFGVGLVVSGMTSPAKVLGFLDVFGAWDPSLAFVMVGAIAVHAVLYRFVRRRSGPLFADRFLVPERTDIDGRLVVGAALFGIGWGLSGICPGPGLVVLAAGVVDGAVPLLAFMGALVGGMALFELWSRVREALRSPSADG